MIYNTENCHLIQQFLPNQSSQYQYNVHRCPITSCAAVWEILKMYTSAAS